jgi:hypothetical protein
MSMEIVRFEGDALEVVRDERGVWVSTRRACEALELDFSAQRSKLETKEWATVAIITTVGADGKPRDMHMLHLDALPMWLATIDTNRVADHVRPKLAKYQRECARVLRDHFFGGQQVASAPMRADAAVDRERRLMAREQRLAAKLVIDTVERMETLAPAARDALRAKALEPAIGGDVAVYLPKVSERFITITQAGDFFGVSSSMAGRARKAAGVVGNVDGVCEVRLGKSPHSDRNVEQTLVTARGASMIGAQLRADGHISIATYEMACERHKLPPVSVEMFAEIGR